jgi:two-component system, sensor histidine kinase and response regulator
MKDRDKTRDELIQELAAARKQLSDLTSGAVGDGAPRPLFADGLKRPQQQDRAHRKAIESSEGTQSIDLSTLFTGDMTLSGSFDIRGDIWASTFGQVLQALPIPALMIDSSFRVVAANQAWGRIGVSDEKIRSSPFANLFSDSDAATKAQVLIEQVFSTRKPRMCEIAMEVHGKKIWSRLTFRSIRVIHERFILALVENLTRERAQLQANERLRLKLEDLVKKRTEALAQSNDQLTREIVTRRKAEEKLREAYEKLANANSFLENRVRDRTAELEAANRELKEEIALRRKAEEAQRKSDEVHRNIVETALEGIWVIDSGLRTTYVNHVMADMLGYTPDELLGRLLTDFVDEDRSWDHVRRMERRREGLRERYECAFRRKDGREIWAMVSATPLNDDEGRFRGSFAMFTNITERKRIENALKEAKEAAEAASRAKSDFLARMSHEIRTPINGIVGMTELALESELTAEQRSYLNSVALSADTLLRIIDDILDFSRIEAGKFALVSTEFSLRECVFDALIAHSVQAATKGLELVCHVCADVPDGVVGDRGRLGQIIVNLVGNAIKFTDQGEVVAVVQADSMGPENVLLHFCVRDTGIGVSAENRERVFEQFEQIEGSSSRKHGGSGLGLAICRQLVMMMGGRIWLATEVEKGSEFHFTVTLGLMSGSTRWPPASEIAGLSGKRVLIADGNATTRKTLEELLVSWGMKPISRSSGISALDDLRNAAKQGKPFDVALLDASLPERNGFEVAESLRKESGLEMTRIIIHGFARKRSECRDCERLGISNRLSKPLRPSELLAAISSCLKPASTTQPPLSAQAHNAFVTSARSLKILLVEDNLINREVADRMLKKMGHAVTPATNGKEAVSLQEEGDFDLILMDVEMPEMDGVEATKIIREKESGTLRRIPIIALTAHAMTGHREGFLAAGMDGYIPKPIKYMNLYETIETFADKVIRS